MLQLLRRLPTKVSVGLALLAASAAWLLALFADDLSGWALVATLALGAALTVVALGLPLLEQWKATEEARAVARLRLQAHLEPAQQTCSAVATADAEAVIEEWRANEEANCLASLHRERPPITPNAGFLDLDRLPEPAGDDPLSGVTIADLKRFEEREAEGEALTADERKALEAARKSIRRALQPFSEIFGSAVSGFGAAALGAPLSQPERRSTAQYKSQVNDYLDKCEKRLREALLYRTMLTGHGALRLELVNPTDRNFERVQVKLYLPGSVAAVSPEKVSEPTETMPSPPRPFGTRTPLNDLAYALPNVSRFIDTLPAPVIEYGPEIDNSGSARITFDAVTLRPHARLALDPLHLLINEPVGTTIEGTWSATATNADGKVEGTLRIDVVEPSYSVEEVLADLLADENDDGYEDED